VNCGVSDLLDAAFRRHRGQVFRYLRRRAGSAELAEDLTQEVFVSAAAHLSQLDTAQPLLAWLYTVAQSRLLDEARRARRRPVAVSFELVPDQGAELEFGADVAQALRRACLSLGRADRELIALRLFGERTFSELAARLGISEPAAKMRYLRSLRALRAELEREGIEP
jgi:RNA polymerase sigma factor (sigma-70 family)